MKTIAVIDDEQAIITVLKSVLEDEGYHVLTAADGLAGLRLVREARPDLVLIDVMLPSLNGKEVARRVRDDPRLGRIPVILMSAGHRPGPEVDELCRSFLLKPFSIDDVIAAVDQQIA